MNRRFSLDKTYNKGDIQSILSNLEITQTPDNEVVTTYLGKKVAEARVSDQYQYFDFSKFSIELLNHIEEYFRPTKANIEIRSGVQELALRGENFDLNGQTFFKQLCILSSSDKSRSLQMNIGLFRLICKNGAFVGTDDSHAFKVKHFKTLVPDAVKHFVEKLPNFGIIVDKQIEVIGELSKIVVPFSGVAELIVKSKDQEKEVAARLARLKSVSKKLLNSETDRLQDLSSDQILLLKNPEEFNVRATDIDIPADQLFNCYTEIYRNHDSSVINRESKRILNIINTLK